MVRLSAAQTRELLKRAGIKQSSCRPVIKKQPAPQDGARVVQSLVIRDWHPGTNPNGNRPHWAIVRAIHNSDRKAVADAAMVAGWKFVPGRVRLVITLVYPKRPLPDSDNATARCKYLIDGIRWDGHGHGYFTDDSPQWMDRPVVEPVVEKGCKEVRIRLEPVD